MSKSNSLEESKSSDVLCEQTLSQPLLEKAEVELGEKLHWRQRDIAALRELVKQDRSLYCPDDDRFLLMFLRARKFDYERSMQLLRRYYEVRLEYADFFSNYKPSAVKHCYENGVICRLPKLRDIDCTVLLIRNGRWDPAVVPLDDMFRANIMQIEKLIQEDENQINGFMIILDLSEMTLNHAKHFRPFHARKMMSILQHAMPCRLKGIHYVFVPSFFEYVFSMVRPFLSEKLQKRLHFHSTPEYLKEYFDLSIIPTNMGGQFDVDGFCKSWAAEMVKSDDLFTSRRDYGIKKVMTVSDKIADSSADPLSGVTGTFKKLSCD